VTSPRNELDLVILGDLHYIGRAQHTCPLPERNASLGPELVRRAVRQAMIESEPDAIVLMGDLVDNGDAEGADEDLRALRAALPEDGIPILVIPGNHDGDPQRLFSIFNDTPGVHAINGCPVVTFADAYDADDRCTRAQDALGILAEASRRCPDRQIVVLQHSPIHPPIESSYPYTLANAGDVMRAYAASGVILSVSAHYHSGQALSHAGGVGYVTAPALCQRPFRFLRVRVRGREASVQERSLAVESDFPVRDCHVHTQFAYCADRADPVNAADDLARADLTGVAGLCFTEHAGQLYVRAEDFWSAEFLKGRSVLARGRASGEARMAEYRALVDPVRSASVRIGLEVECDDEGCLTILDEDREGLDLLIGALHFPRADADLARYHMEYYERIVRLGIHVLAHPFRYFRRKKMPVPTGLYRPLARLLAAHGVAAEINFHTNIPDARFFEACLEEGARVSLGSDAHALYEVADLNPHLALLREIGVNARNAADALFRP